MILSAPASGRAAKDGGREERYRRALVDLTQQSGPTRGGQHPTYATQTPELREGLGVGYL